MTESETIEETALTKWTPAQKNVRKQIKIIHIRLTHS